ncbi:oxidoreductase [Rhodococcoides trifolii]|uniref:Oxidoreductase n=1 Tax=Rhodococcoides trifolii TaxID=908250 RepID=A0A917FQN9_9NOCA|nr:alpha/beta hydrolase [Rhodococcus trifolii]GGF95239.1 oxidoreductase [Rhodococcus trifolii]
MPDIDLSCGTIEYGDTGGDGPVLVFLHGLTMDGTLWRHVVDRLQPEYRCITPTLPLGGHRRPMNPDADLSLLGMGLLVGEFVERLDLSGVTLIQNDWGGAQVLIANGPTDRIARLVLTACEAFDNYPPGISRKMLTAAMRIPGGGAVLMNALRFTPIRRAPGSWGWMSKRPVPKAVMDNWFRPATTEPFIRRDLRKYVLSVPDEETLLRWAQDNASFAKPVLIVWGTEDKVMPIDHARRLAQLYPVSTLVELADTYTLIPEDRPDALAREIGDFVPRV